MASCLDAGIVYNGDVMNDNATDGQPPYIEAAHHALARYESNRQNLSWSRLGGDRQEALQRATIRAWKAMEEDDGQTEQMLHLIAQAQYGLKDYVRELRKDQEKRSSARVVQVGLDDEEVVWKTQEISLDDEDCSIQPEAAPEVHGEEAGPSDSQMAIRSLVDTVLVGTLSGRERQVVRLRFGFDGEPLTQAQIAKVTGMSQPTVYRVLDEAMKVLRAELRAEEIVGL